MKLVQKFFNALSIACIAGMLFVASSVRAAPADDYFLAIKNDNDGAVVTLLFRGLDANTVDGEGRHGLHLAMMEGSFKVAKTLLDLSGTQVDTRSKQDETPLMIAALKGHTTFAKRMIARGADVNKTGWTPLHYAATSGHLEMIKLLIDESAYIDTESPNQSTPLMLAAMYGTEPAVKLLLQEGADPSVKNQLGLNAADFAAKAERMDLARFLDKLAKEGVNPKTGEVLEKKVTSVAASQTVAPASEPTTSTNSTRKPLAPPSYAAKSELAPNGRMYAAINYGNPILAVRNPATGEPAGVSVDLSRELARRLGVSVQLVTFDAAGKVVEAMKSGSIDVAFVAIDPARAVDISYSAAYVVIEGAYQASQANQAMATIKGRDAGAAYLREFVEEMKASGFVAQALAQHKIEGAAVAPLLP
jgi:uncharacterized protein